MKGVLHGWDGGVSGHVTCSCGRKTLFFAYDDEHCVTCRGCGAVYVVKSHIKVERAPEERQTGAPDLAGFLTPRVTAQEKPPEGGDQ